jgi:hypothetical protein
MAHTLEFTTSLPCINNYKFCPQDLLREKYEGEQMMTFDQFITILNKVPKHVDILFAGFSEPFTNRQSSTMMKYAFKQRYEVCLFSTLVGCTDIDIDIISGIKFKTCTIHIPDNINFVIENEDKWIETYKKFKSKIAITENHFHIGQPNEKIREVTVWGIHPTVQSRANTVDPNISIDRYKKGTLKCPAMPTGVVLPNGDVALCCMDYGLKHKLGNLLTDSYDDLYNSAEYKRVMAGMTDESIESICRYCYTQEGVIK